MKTIRTHGNAWPSHAFLVESATYEYIVIAGDRSAQEASTELNDALQRMQRQGAAPQRVLSLYGRGTYPSPTQGAIPVGLCEVLWSTENEHLITPPVAYAMDLQVLGRLGVILPTQVQA